MQAAPLALVVLFAALVRRWQAVFGVEYLGSPGGGRIPFPLLAVVMERIRGARERFARLAACIVAGTWRPRRFAGRRPALGPKPRTESPARTFGWLAAMLPPAVGQECRSGLLHLLHQPEMAALAACAPAPIARLFRPLCWALRVRPPPVLAIPRRVEGEPPPPRAYRPPPPPPPPIPGPSNTLGLYPVQMRPMRAGPETA